MSLSFTELSRIARRDAKLRFDHIGDGSNPLDAIYVLFESVLKFCIYNYDRYAERKEISITVNDAFHKTPSQIEINVNGKALPLPSRYLYRTAADSYDIHEFLMSPKGLANSDIELSLSRVNALSEFFLIGFKNNHMESILKYEHQSYFFDLVETEEKDGVFIKFIPDTEVFGKCFYKIECLIPIIARHAINCSNVTVTLKEGWNGEPIIFEPVKTKELSE